MVEISLSGSGEGPQAETPGAYSTEARHPEGRKVQGAPLSADRENETAEGGFSRRDGLRRHRATKRSKLPRGCAGERGPRKAERTRSWLHSRVMCPWPS
jgi:hypothetical protein